MPTVYERVEYGTVTERVQPVDSPDDYENTRLGVAVLDAFEAAERHELPGKYWRVEGQRDPASLPHAHGEPVPESTNTPAEDAGLDTPADKPATETESTEVNTAPAVDTTADAKPARRTPSKEK